MGSKLIGMVLLFIVLVSSLCLASDGTAWDFSNGAPVEYWMGEWILQEPAPTVTVRIEKFLGSKDGGGLTHDFYSGSVSFPEEFGLPEMPVTKIPDYSFTEMEVFYFPMSKGKDQNAICVTRYKDSTNLLLRVVYEHNGQKTHVKLLGNGAKVHENDRMILLQVDVVLPDGEQYKTPSPKCFDIISMIRQ